MIHLKKRWECRITALSIAITDYISDRVTTFSTVGWLYGARDRRLAASGA